MHGPHVAAEPGRPRTVRVSKLRLQAGRSVTCVVCDEVLGPDINIAVSERHLCSEHADYILIPADDDRGDVEVFSDGVNT